MTIISSSAIIRSKKIYKNRVSFIILDIFCMPRIFACLFDTGPQIYIAYIYIYIAYIYTHIHQESKLTLLRPPHDIICGRPLI